MGLAAQEMTAEEKKAEKEFYESVEREIERLTNSLKLEDWQVFYVDSILTHDYKAMQAFQKVFDEDQWTKYLKSGAARDKKTRDKKRNR